LALCNWVVGSHLFHSIARIRALQSSALKSG
jgi:hypothetical protein